MITTDVTWLQVAASVLLVAVAVAVAVHQRFGLTRDLLIASARAAAQLAAVGVVLLLLFQHAGLLGAAGWVGLMVLVAGHVAGRRGRGVPRGWLLATVAIAVGSLVSLASLLLLGVLPARPEVVVPIGGMIVATAMQATGLTLLRLVEDVRHARPVIEARLALAMSLVDAFAPHRRSAARTALLPAIDSTKVVGLISLPGAMTGLILAGVDPLTAIRYQIVVMYMLLAAATVAAAVASHLAQRRLFDTTAHRLRR
ncbi:iron export ABC transporter permease subunit FetB [Pseudonocardia sp. C8]|uniref:Iron export ABC transporter permease subunit FetB n=1 Tax=Saccharopolyspora cebuensis TaxID=418759 RepID=A0ABV4CBC9_9PSEU|nr:iron export ABC transporter permease subunit FetB [Pseudonocardia sp. C8]MBC3193917.1 iron export ABC transporter permease subunit FetB [Pseudonocardia sp. C8]